MIQEREREVFMKKEAITLSEGITLHYIPTDKFTSNHFSIHFVTALAKETVSLYSLLSKIFMNGCDTSPSKELVAKRTAELYAAALSASVMKIGEEQTVSLSINTLDDRFAYDGMRLNDEAFSLLCRVLLHPAMENGIFPATVVEREKKVLIDEIDASINNKNAYAIKRCREIMCEGELYSLSVDGDRSDVKEITPAALYEAYQRLLKNARVEMIYVGREAIETVRMRAAGLAKTLGARRYSYEKTEKKSAAEDVKRAKEMVSAVQGKLAMGFRFEEKDGCSLDAIRLFNLIYGTSPISKLFMNVRERLSLCYYCASRIDAVQGVMFVYSGVDNNNMTVAEEEILRQLEETVKGNITEDELLCAKKTFRDLSRSVTDSALSIERWVLDKAVSGEDRLPAEVCASIERLTVEDVARVASSVRLDTVFCLLGNEKKGGRR